MPLSQRPRATVLSTFAFAISRILLVLIVLAAIVGTGYAIVHSFTTWPFVMLGTVAIALASDFLSRWFRRKEPEGPALNEIAEAYLRKKADLDSAKFYAVVVDTDMGILIAHCESCPFRNDLGSPSFRRWPLPSREFCSF